MTNKDVVVDVGAFVERLLLFDTYILQSRNLQEVPHLIRRFGLDSLVRLLESGAVQLSPEKVAVSLVERQGERRDPYKFEVAAFRMDQPAAAEGDLANLIGTLDCVDVGNRKRLDWALRSSMRLDEEDAAAAVGSDVRSQLDRMGCITPFVNAALARKNASRLGQAFTFDVDVAEGELGLLVQVSTDLERSYGLRPRYVGEVARNAVLALGNESTRLHQMRTHTALTGFRNEDVPLVRGRLDFLQGQIDPGVPAAQFYRVVEAAGVPDLRDPAIADTVDLNEVLEARGSEELRQFRDWLWSLDDVDQAELEERVRSLRARVGIFAKTTPGRIIRFIATTGLGAIPGAGSILGPVSSWADSFLSERLISSVGPAAFIGTHYTSLFSTR